MNVTLDSGRLLHLLVLLGLSYAGGKLVLHCLDGWSPMSAYGLAITVVCQVNNVLVQQQQLWTLPGPGEGNGQGNEERQGEGEGVRTKKEGDRVGNPKKKKK
jgi:hypothetical protein